MSQPHGSDDVQAMYLVLAFDGQRKESAGNTEPGVVDQERETREARI